MIVGWTKDDRKIDIDLLLLEYLHTFVSETINLAKTPATMLFHKPNHHLLTIPKGMPLAQPKSVHLWQIPKRLQRNYVSMW